MGETHTLIFALFPSMGLYCGYCMVCISVDVSLALKMQSVGWSSAGGCQQGCHVLCVFLCDFNISIWSFPAHCNKTSLRCTFSSLLSVLVRKRDGFKVRRVDVLHFLPHHQHSFCPVFFWQDPALLWAAQPCKLGTPRIYMRAQPWATWEEHPSGGNVISHPVAE